MGIIETIIDFFESIFKRSSPEVQKKILLKKMDTEIQGFVPLICKQGYLQPNFGEAIYALYKNSRPLDNLFALTVSPNDIPRQHRFEAQLIITGYSAKDQEIVSELQFQNRKDSVLSEYENADRIYLHQRHQLDKIVKELNGDSFKQIDKDLLMLRQLVELCRYNFVPFMQLFDTNFVSADLSYTPKYAAVEINKAINLMEDLYYQISGLKISNSTAAAVLALLRIKKGSDLTNEESATYISHIKRINFVISKILTPEKLKKLIRYCKQDVNYEPRVANISGSPRKDFASLLQSKFDADEQRIKSEIQDEKLTEEISALFAGESMEDVSSYNHQYNEILQSETPLSFQWILPIKVLKSFEMRYMAAPVKALLNDLVIEGFFNNPTYKSEFSTLVYSVINGGDEISEFENSFGANQKNSIAVLQSYIKDSRKDKDFYKRLEKMVITINNEAHALLQKHVTNLFSLYKEIGELLADAKKPSSEIIQNLKVLVLSSRNRENTNLLESQYPNWKIFFEIMKNYVIITNGEMQ